MFEGSQSSCQNTNEAQPCACATSRDPRYETISIHDARPRRSPPRRGVAPVNRRGSGAGCHQDRRRGAAYRAARQAGPGSGQRRKLAVAEWNTKGGVLGKQIEVLEADDQGNPQVGVAAGEKVAADPAVMGAVWGITSVTCIPVSEIFEKADLVMISPGCSNPKVTDRGLKSVTACARATICRARPASSSRSTSSRRRRSRSSTTAPPAARRGRRGGEEGKAHGRGGSALRHPLWRQGLPRDLGTVPKDVDLIYATLGRPTRPLSRSSSRTSALTSRMGGPDGQYEPVDYIEASAGAAEGNYVTFFVPDMKKLPTADAFVEAFEAEYGTSAPTARLPMRPPTSCSPPSRRSARPIALRSATRCAPPKLHGHPGFPDQFRC